MVSKQVFKLGSRADGGVEAGSDNCMHPALRYLGSQQLGEQQVHRHQQDLLHLHHQHLPRQHLTQGQVDRQAPGYRGLEDISHTRFSTMDGPGDWWYPPEDSSTHLTPPHHEVEAEVMAPPGDSIPQDRVSPDGSPLPTSHQLGTLLIIKECLHTTNVIKASMTRDYSKILLNPSPAMSCPTSTRDLNFAMAIVSALLSGAILRFTNVS